MSTDFTIGLNLRDWQHAARLYVDDTYRLAPKPKFLHYAVFNINQNAIPQGTQFQQQSQLELNYLVKKMDLPRYTLNVEELNQYNRKTKTYTSISYDPVKITMHDDNIGVTNSLWALYYGYYIADRMNIASPYTDTNPPAYKPHTYDGKDQWSYRYGLDNDIQDPFFKSVQLITLSKRKFTSYLLCNPKITSWEHDTMDQSEGNGVVENNMTLVYDAVIYSSGVITNDNPTGFAVLHYDNSMSPLNLPNQLLLQSTTFGGLETTPANFFEPPAFNPLTPVTAGVSGLQQLGLAATSSGLLSYGSASYLNPLAYANSAVTTSGLQSYLFPTAQTVSAVTTGTTNTGLATVSDLGNTILTAPVDNSIYNSPSVIQQGINSQFSSVGINATPVISDVYSSSLPTTTLALSLIHISEPTRPY